jgi:hypothetical protein
MTQKTTILTFITMMTSNLVLEEGPKAGVQKKGFYRIMDGRLPTLLSEKFSTSM